MVTKLIKCRFTDKMENRKVWIDYTGFGLSPEHSDYRVMDLCSRGNQNSEVCKQKNRIGGSHEQIIHFT